MSRLRPGGVLHWSPGWPVVCRRSHAVRLQWPRSRVGMVTLLLAAPPPVNLKNYSLTPTIAIAGAASERRCTRAKGERLNSRPHCHRLCADENPACRPQVVVRRANAAHVGPEPGDRDGKKPHRTGWQLYA